MQRISERIEAGVKRELLHRLMPMMVHHHCKNHWRFECDCEYCTRKKTITHILNVDSWNCDDRRWEDWAVFRAKKHWLSNELKQLKSEAMESI